MLFLFLYMNRYYFPSFKFFDRPTPSRQRLCVVCITNMMYLSVLREFLPPLLHVLGVEQHVVKDLCKKRVCVGSSGARMTVCDLSCQKQQSYPDAITTPLPMNSDERSVRSFSASISPDHQ
mmetsp:Transcript_42250/g.62592  ORF Transcript_42250/g.62592 Transcript_42250/m.62592 type:complete len:121 (+) Transcript_42250:737-1099(+)